MGESEIRVFLEQYGQALSQAGLPAIRDCWSAPSLVLSDQGAIAVAALAEVEAFFKQTVAEYHKQGLAGTRPTHIQITPLDDRLAAVDVRWEAFDANGQRRALEHSHYILWQGDDGQPHIRVALTREDNG